MNLPTASSIAGTISSSLSVSKVVMIARDALCGSPKYWERNVFSSSGTGCLSSQARSACAIAQRRPSLCGACFCIWLARLAASRCTDWEMFEEAQVRDGSGPYCAAGGVEGVNFPPAKDASAPRDPAPPAPAHPARAMTMTKAASPVAAPRAREVRASWFICGPRAGPPAREGSRRLPRVFLTEEAASGCGTSDRPRRPGR
jgi:hypothetical protein